MSLKDFNISLLDEASGREVRYSIDKNRITVNYPCNDIVSCTPYVISLPKGLYLFTLYGASAGTPNAKEGLTAEDSPNAGGKVSGYISLSSRTSFYATLGGRGRYYVDSSNSGSAEIKGGYNGGGSAMMSDFGDSSGGGASDIRFVKNDLFHRVLVAGAGGGQDDSSTVDSNDGKGGPGGGEEGGKIVIKGNQIDGFVANQSHGFTFGSGEAAQHIKSLNSEGYQKGDDFNGRSLDHCGSGSGWFGGFASHHCNGGCGGGSSFALTKETKFESTSFTACNEFFTNCNTSTYAFTKNRKYFFQSVEHNRGVWYGNGKFEIKLILPNFVLVNTLCRCRRTTTQLFFFLTLINS